MTENVTENRDEKALSATAAPKEADHSIPHEPHDDDEHPIPIQQTFSSGGSACLSWSSDASLPLSVDANTPLDHASEEEVWGSLTYLNGLALVVGLQIGSGIFSAPSEVSKHVSSSTIGVSVWLVAGLLVWTGAASFIELGRAIPHNGGVQEYLRRCYGDFYGFMFSWIWITITKPCAIAIIATIFAEHLNRAIFPEAWASIWLDKLVALAGLALITALNCVGTNTGASAANAFLILKLSALFSIVLIGFAAGATKKVAESTEPSQVVGPGDVQVWNIIGEYVTALFGALFCYGGWETVGFVAGDMENPVRDLPRVINSAMGIVLIGFVLMNTALYVVVPMDALRDQQTVAVTFGSQVFGALGALAYSLIVSLSCLGALNANVFATGRLVVAASKRNYFPKFLGDTGCASKDEEQVYYRHLFKSFPSRITSTLLQITKWTQDPRWDQKLPVHAMIFNSLLASFYVMIGTFGFLITFIGVSEYLFFFFAVCGVFVLRRRPGHLKPNHRTFSFNPVIFCVVSGFLVLRGIITAPIQGIALLFCIFLGLIIRRFLGQGEITNIENVNL